jgi:hypothetical protein
MNTGEAWTTAHDAYCLSNKLEGCAKLIWQWLNAHSDQQHEPDLADFNKWVRKHRGKPFHRDTIKLAWQKLIDSRIINPLKRFTWKVWRIGLKSISSLIDSKPRPRKSSRLHKQIRDLGAETAESSSRVINSSSLINPDTRQILRECEQAGFNFVLEENPRVLAYSLELVQIAIAYFEFRHPNQQARDKIRSCEGWLIYCLEHETWKENQRFYGYLCAYDILPIEVVGRCFDAAL